MLAKMIRIMSAWEWVIWRKVTLLINNSHSNPNSHLLAFLWLCSTLTNTKRLSHHPASTTPSMTKTESTSSRLCCLKTRNSSCRLGRRGRERKNKDRAILSSSITMIQEEATSSDKKLICITFKATLPLPYLFPKQTAPKTITNQNQ